MKNKALLLPPWLVLNFILLSVITSLVRLQSDMAVIVGLMVVAGAGYGNYFFLKYITKNQKSK